MAAGDIILTGTISTSAASDVYPTHKAELCLGGYRSVADIAARNAIPSQRREEGMAVYVVADGKKTKRIFWVDTRLCDRNNACRFLWWYWRWFWWRYIWSSR